MAKKTVYFDYNVFIEYMKNEDVKNKINLLKSKCQYVYSPAYLEEVANIKGNQERIDNHIKIIGDLFGNMELIPTQTGGILKVYEHPQKCYSRVKKLYYLTELAEKYNNSFLSQNDLFNNIRKHSNIKTIEINNIKPEDIFFDSRIKDTLVEYREFSDYYLFEENLWASIKDKFSLIQINISNLFDILEALGYYPEKEKNYVSRIHDVTHSIYATKADYFVTYDKNLERKCRAVYSFLGVPTKVISYTEFSQHI